MQVAKKRENNYVQNNQKLMSSYTGIRFFLNEKQFKQKKSREAVLSFIAEQYHG